MALQIIGAGFGRTGTESMKRALEMLGFGPCYHMYEVLPDRARYAHWLSVMRDGADPRLDETFAGFRATVDWPGAAHWRELAEHFPQAKVLLTVRDPEAWYHSMDNTILPMMRDPDGHPDMAQALRTKVFGPDIAVVQDRHQVLEVYRRHIEEVQATIAPERLLTYELGAGWAPLCEWLGVPEPQADYPAGNASDGFQDRDRALGARREGT